MINWTLKLEIQQTAELWKLCKPGLRIALRGPAGLNIAIPHNHRNP